MFVLTQHIGFCSGEDGLCNTFPTLNPSDKGADFTLSGGDLTFSHSGVNNGLCRATHGSATKDYYFELVFNTSPSDRTGVGVAVAAVSTSVDFNTASLGDYCCGIVWNTTGWQFYSEGQTGSSGSFTGATGDVFGVYVRNSTDEILFYHQGSLIATEGLPNSGVGTWFPTVSDQTGASDGPATIKFDPDSWAQTPAGITAGNALCAS